MGAVACEASSMIQLRLPEGVVAAGAAFGEAYADVHPWLAGLICVAGTGLNILTLSVLTRPRMVQLASPWSCRRELKGFLEVTPVNILLSAIATCDLVVDASTAVFLFHFEVDRRAACERAGDFSRGWATFALVHAHASLLAHSTSLWLTVALAAIRLLSLRSVTAAAAGLACLHSPRPIVGLALLVLALCAAVNLPNFATFSVVCIREVADCDPGNRSLFSYFMPLATADCGVQSLTFWLTGIAFKILPCFLLTVAIILLVLLLSRITEGRKRLWQSRRRTLTDASTNSLLLAVLIIFLLTELPQGLAFLAVGLFAGGFRRLYSATGALFDLLSLVNSASSFILYCIMSRKFRAVFAAMYLPGGCTRDLPKPLSLRQRQASRRSRKPATGLGTVSVRILPAYPRTGGWLQGDAPQASPESLSDQEDLDTASTRIGASPLT